MDTTDARILRGAAVPTLVAGAVALAVCGLLAGGAGVVGAALGVVVVLAFFGISIVAVSYSARVSPQTLMPVAMFTYLVKIFAMLGLIAVLRDASWMNGRAFGFTIVGCTAVWLAFEIRVFVKTKMLYVEPSSGVGKGL
jgi:ATP synthase protein I